MTSRKLFSKNLLHVLFCTVIFLASAAHAQDAQKKAQGGIKGYLTVLASARVCKTEIDAAAREVVEFNIKTLRPISEWGDEALQQTRETAIIDLSKEADLCTLSAEQFDARLGKIAKEAFDASDGSGAALKPVPATKVSMKAGSPTDSSSLSKFAAEKAAIEKAAAEKIAAIEKAAGEKAVATEKAAAEKIAAVEKTATEKIAAAVKAAIDKVAAERAAIEETEEKNNNRVLNLSIMVEIIAEECNIKITDDQSLSIDNAQYYWRGKGSVSSSTFKAMRTYWENEVGKNKKSFCAKDFGFKDGLVEVIESIN